MRSVQHITFLFALLTFLSFSQVSYAQTIQGTFAVNIGPTYTYTYDAGYLITGITWVVGNGTITSTGSSGTTYTATVVYKSTGTTSIKIQQKSGRTTDLLDTQPVTITACSISSPVIDGNSLLRCGGGSLTLKATSGSGGNNVNWYDAAGIFQGQGISFTTASMSRAQTFYATSVNTATGCESTPKTAISTSILPIPDEASIVSTASVCGSGMVTLVAAPSTGTVAWYTDNVNGTVNSGSIWQGQTYQPSLAASTTYYIASFVDYGVVCETPPNKRVAITGIVNFIPSQFAVSVSSNGSYCDGATGPTVTLGGSQTGVNYQLLKNGSPIGNTIAGTGGALNWDNQTGTLGVNTIYTVSATSFAGCTQGMNGSASITVNPLPTQFSMGNGSGYCEGGAGSTVTLNGSQSDVNYQLVLNDISIVGSLPGTGQPLAWDNQSGGTYTVLATSSSGCTQTMSGSSTVSINPMPSQLSLANSGNYCFSSTGMTITLLGNQQGVNYQLFINDIPANSMPTSDDNGYLNWDNQITPGKYTVVGTSTSEGCTQAMNGTITINTLPAQFSMAEGGSYCVGSPAPTVSLTGSEANVTYQLLIDDSPAANVPAVAGTGGVLNWPNQTTSGSYSVSAVTSAGCSIVTANSVAVEANPIPVASAPNQTIFVGNSSNVTLGSNVASTTFSYTVTASTNVTNATSGTGEAIAQPLTVTDGVNAGNVTYSVTPSASGCVGAPVTCVVRVYPTPVTLVNNVAANSSTTYYNTYGRGVKLATKNMYAAYQWYNNSTAITGASAYTYAPLAPGSYTVMVTATAGGPTFLSAAVTVAAPGLQKDSVNAISRTVFYKAGVTTATSPFTLLPTDLAQQVTYTDGLGRPVQTISVGQSPTNADIVLPTVPGRNGLADSTFLPYVTKATEGRFRYNAVRGSALPTSYTTSEQYLFYQNPTNAATKLASDANPFARAVFRNSPDARVIEQGAPGTAWQPGTGHTVRNQRQLATASTYPVLRWNANGTTTGYYPDITVWVTIITDENNNQVRTFTNKLGQTVLKQVQAGANTWLSTYYIYDVYGQLVYQVPPQAMAVLGTGTNLNLSNASVKDLIFKYTYDKRGRLVQKKVPNSGSAYTVYDPLDRVVLTQNALQRRQGVWMFVKYDYKNRPVYYGQLASTATRATLQAQLDALDYNTQPYFETATANAAYQGYSNTVFPTAGLTVLGAMYYDTYDFDRDGTADYAYDATQLTGLPTTAQTAIRGLPTGSKQVIMGTANWLTSYVFYDNLDRPLQTRSNNHLNLALNDVTSILYFANNLTTKAQKIKMVHTGPTTVTVTQRYTYDNGWRTTGVYHTINTNAEQQVAGYVYNALGQLVTKQLHKAGAAFLQNVDMRYTIRGWLASINNAQLTSDGGLTNSDANDYFGMELLYDKAEGSGLGNTPSFNGNISAVKWKGASAAGAADQRGYVYNYDNSDRLTSASFKANVGNAWTKEVGTLNEAMAYDANGNLKKLLRHTNQPGMSASGTTLTITSTPKPIDSLSYFYQGGNQLTKVNDSGTAQGFGKGSGTGAAYTYDSLGNLNKDANKGIDSIKYNVLGKPVRIKFSNGNVVTYLYDASGTKLAMVNLPAGTAQATTDYVGGFVYTNASLTFFSSPEGRVVVTPLSPGEGAGVRYEYQYSIADHLGNPRVVFTSATQTTQTVTATFEDAAQATEAQSFSNYPSGARINPVASNNHTTGGSRSLVLTGGLNSQVGVAKSYQVYAGDKISIGAWARYDAPTGTGSNLTGFAASLLGAYGLAAPAAGEVGTPRAGLNSWGSLEAGGFGSGSKDNTNPKAFVNILLFDQNFNLVDVAYSQVKSSGAPTSISASYTVKKAGYAFVYVSNESAKQTHVYFDDVAVSYTPTSVVQYNEYYPYGLQTSNSWTRAGTTNNFLANGGTELNPVTQVYDLDFRNYDPALGRLNQVDPMADKYSSLSPYHYSFNNPARFNDPSGLEPGGSIAYGTYRPGPQWVAGDQARDIGGGGGGAPRWNGNGGYYLDSNGNGVQDHAETMVGYYEVQHYYRNAISTIYDSNQDIGIGGFSYNYDGQAYGGYYYTQNGKVFATAVTASFYSNGGLVGVAGAVAKVTLYFDPRIAGAPAWDLNRDGLLTHNEANNWYRVGNGLPITVDAGLIDLSHVDPELFSRNKTATVNLLTKGPIYVGIVYGKLDLTYQGGNRVSITRNSYDFRTDDHPWSDNFWRNVFTVIGGVNAGFGYGGKEFMINFKGSGFLIVPPSKIP